MKKSSIIASLLLLCGCSEKSEFLQIDTPQVENELTGVVMSVPEFVLADDAVTRTTLTPTSTGMSFAWAEGDKVGIYTSETSMANFDINEISADAMSASFTGGGFSLTEGATYYAFYPYDAASTNKTAVKVDYTNQTQVSNSDCSHLSASDYMVAKAIATGANKAEFDFAHLSAIVRFKITLPVDGTFTSLSITSPTAITTKGTVDLTAETPIVASSQSSQTIVLNLNNITTTNKTLTAYLLLPPTDLSGVDLTCTVKDNASKTYSGVVAGKNLVAGHAYGNILTVAESYKEHPYVDLGLPSGIKWATCNIGANRPEEYGQYFAWGETTPQASNRYGWDSYKWSSGGTVGNPNVIKYYENDNVTILVSSDDAATVNWGGYWRTPTLQEQDELRTYCYWEWTTSYNGTGIKGYIVYKTKSDSDRGYNKTPSNSYSLSDPHIFLPAAGNKYNSQLSDETSHGYYWSRTLRDVNSSTAYMMKFISTYVDYQMYLSRCVGAPVRAIYSVPTSVSSITLNKTSVKLAPGNTETLSATILPTNATYKTLTWTSYNVNVAKVSSSGQITAVADGTVIIKATAADGSGQSATCRVTVDKYGVPVVDLGLPSGTIWAEENVGPKDQFGRGGYYAWGEIATKSNYTDSKYTHVGTTTLTVADDAARHVMGGKWRIPSKAQWEELFEGCTWESLSYACIGTSKTNGKTITFRYYGYVFDGNSPETSLESGDDVYSIGYYWTRDYGQYRPYYADFTEQFTPNVTTGNEKYWGLQIRAVWEE